MRRLLLLLALAAGSAAAQEFWSWYASQPRRVARPEEIDFTYYWLRPHAPDGASR